LTEERHGQNKTERWTGLAQANGLKNGSGQRILCARAPVRAAEKIERQRNHGEATENTGARYRREQERTEWWTKITTWSFNKKLITKRQNLAGARFESSEQKSQAGSLIWWQKTKTKWDLPVVGTELSWQATQFDRARYSSDQLILQRITKNGRQKSKRKNKSLCSHGRGPGKRTEERKQRNENQGKTHTQIRAGCTAGTELVLAHSQTNTQTTRDSDPAAKTK
jgi:hypothetical protein